MYPQIMQIIGQGVKPRSFRILREWGIVVFGPLPHILIDAVSPTDLRQAARSIVHGWAPRLLTNANWVEADGYHSYIILTLCRILYTIETGAVGSKRTSVEWARTALTNPWLDLIERAWLVRQTWHQRQPGAISLLAGQSDVTNAFIRYALEQG